MNDIKILGSLIVIVAPSGTGKSTLIEKLKKDFPQIEESISYTTRPRREGEEHGKNYFFIDESEFQSKKSAGDFLESALVHSNYYGTCKRYLEQNIKEGKRLLFDLDVQGAEYFKDYFKNRAKIIFLEPPNVEELRQRLIKRGTEDVTVIEERVENAKKELLKKNEFDYLVKNEDIDTAYTQLRKIFQNILKDE